MKRRDLIGRGALVLLLGPARIARGATVVGVRVWPAPEYSRLTIESDGQLTSTQVVTVQPPRLAVDIRGLDLTPQFTELVGKVRPDDPFIARIQASQHGPGVVRLLVDLKQAAVPQVFTLPPVAAYRHRLVVDLHPVQPVDPLEAFIAEQGQVEVGCDFCGAMYRYDPIEAAQVFLQPAQQAPASDQKH